jgi:hypothetical protein
MLSAPKENPCPNGVLKAVCRRREGSPPGKHARLDSDCMEGNRKTLLRSQRECSKQHQNVLRELIFGPNLMSRRSEPVAAPSSLEQGFQNQQEYLRQPRSASKQDHLQTHSHPLPLRCHCGNWNITRQTGGFRSILKTREIPIRCRSSRKVSGDWNATSTDMEVNVIDFENDDNTSPSLLKLI